MSMTNVKAFITGGAVGIGRAFTEVLLAEGAAMVHIADKNEVAGRATLTELDNQYGAGRCLLHVLDITDHRQFKEAFAAAVSQSGHIDVMVNNAGSFNEENWEPIVKLNLVSCIHGCELAMEHMSKMNGGRGGRIINTCSDLALTHTPVLPVYSATKHAVRAYTSGMAMHPDQEETGVQFAGICPGPTHTGLLQTLTARTARYVDSFKQEVMEEATTTSRIAEGFLKLVRMPKINGAILLINKKDFEFCTLEKTYVGLGSVWTHPQLK